MATATVRNVDDEDYGIVTAGAKRHGRSTSEELRLAISEHARKLRVEMQIERMREIRAMSVGKLGPYPDSVAHIRAVRDEE